MTDKLAVTGKIIGNDAAKLYIDALQEIIERSKAIGNKEYTRRDKLRIFKVDMIELIKDILIKISFLIHAYFGKKIGLYNASIRMLKNAKIIDPTSLLQSFNSYKAVQTKKDEA